MLFSNGTAEFSWIRPKAPSLEQRDQFVVHAERGLLVALQSSGYVVLDADFGQLIQSDPLRLDHIGLFSLWPLLNSSRSESRLWRSNSFNQSSKFAASGTLPSLNS